MCTTVRTKAYNIVRLCTPLYNSVHQCTTVYTCVQMCTNVYKCVQLCTTVTTLYNIVYHYTTVYNHKDIISDINEELLFPFLQENIKNATLNTNLDSWYYQQKTAFYNELSITAYIHL